MTAVKPNERTGRPSQATRRLFRSYLASNTEFETTGQQEDQEVHDAMR